MIQGLLRGRVAFKPASGRSGCWVGLRSVRGCFGVGLGGGVRVALMGCWLACSLACQNAVDNK